MEVTKISDQGIRIKTKLAIFAVNPVGIKGKITADALLLFDKNLTKKDISVENEPLFINGPGDYEIKSVKLAGVGKGNSLCYTGKIENIDICIVKASELMKIKDLMQDSQIIIIDADEIVEQNSIVALNANIIVFYGVHAQENSKKLGKESIPVTKYSITKDKLPSELEVVVLG